MASLHVDLRLPLAFASDTGTTPNTTLIANPSFHPITDCNAHPNTNASLVVRQSRVAFVEKGVGALTENVPLTLALLRLDPMFDPLRNDPRFQKLAASEAPKQ